MCKCWAASAELQLVAVLHVLQCNAHGQDVRCLCGAGLSVGPTLLQDTTLHVLLSGRVRLAVHVQLHVQLASVT